MRRKQRGPGQTATAISLSEELLRQVNARAKSLRMTRSAYVVQLIRNDLLARGKLQITPDYPAENLMLNEAGSDVSVEERAPGKFPPIKRRKRPKKDPPASPGDWAKEGYG